MNNMNITSAKYYADVTGTNVAISATINGQTMSVPLDPDNRHYAEILRQVEEKKLTIKEADE